MCVYIYKYVILLVLVGSGGMIHFFTMNNHPSPPFLTAPDGGHSIYT